MTDASHGQVVGSAAEVYEQFFVPALFAQWPPQVLDAAGVATGDRVLDVGCGTGIVAAAAAARVGDGGRVVGLDPNEPMLTVARRRPERIEWRTGVAESIPFEDGAFDRVVSQFALMFFTDRAGGLREMARVLRTGGTVAVATWAPAAASPGYAVLIDLVGRVVGGDAAAALAAPFELGDSVTVHDLVAASFGDAQVQERHGVARFESIAAWVHTDARGWILGDMIDDEMYDELLAAALVELAPFTDAAGHVEFAVPALITTGRRHR